jgi:antitoxin component of RelBE/YafQ-DinJ toxin-antitoxin module
MTGQDLIRTRIDADLKRAFEEACTRNDRTASQVLRDLIRDYVKKNAQGDLLKVAK